jgi:hypothetical protein
LVAGASAAFSAGASAVFAAGESVFSAGGVSVASAANRLAASRPGATVAAQAAQMLGELLKNLIFMRQLSKDRDEKTTRT